MPADLLCLSFKVPPDRRPAFDEAFQRDLAPLLTRYGIAVSSCQDVAPTSAVKFLIQRHSGIWDQLSKLATNSAWKAALRALGETFCSRSEDGLLWHRYFVCRSYIDNAKPHRLDLGVPTPAPPGAAVGYIRNMDATDGLTNTRILALYQDEAGYLWFGTYHGALRFDGHHFTALTMEDGLINNAVTALREDLAGNLWLGTTAGLCRYRDGRIKAYTTDDGLSNDRITCLHLANDGTLWIGTSAGLCRYDGQAFQSFTAADGLPSNNVYAIDSDGQETLWIGTNDGVARYAEDTVTSLDLPLPPSTTHSIYDLLVDDQDLLWIGTGQGVLRYDGQVFRRFTQEQGLPADRILRLGLDRQRALWVSSVRGLARYDGQNFHKINRQDGLINNGASALAADREGHLWAGTATGTSRLDCRTPASPAWRTDLSGIHTLCLCPTADGDFWLGTWSGLYRHGKEGFHALTDPEVQPPLAFKTLLRDGRDRLWLGTNTDLRHLDDQTLTRYTYKAPWNETEYSALLLDADDIMWAATSWGLMRLHEGTITAYRQEDGLPDDTVYSLAHAVDGRLWVGTAKGLCAFDGETFDWQEDVGIKEILCMLAAPDGTLWVGTSSGVYVYDAQGCRPLGLGMGLDGIQVRCLYRDRRDRLWFGTAGGGVVRYDGQVAQRLTTADGLAGNIVEAIYEDADDAFWICTDNGISRYCPPAPAPIPIYIDAVVADRHYEQTDRVEIPDTAGLIQFSFHAISFKTRPGGLVYRFRLKGHDDTWQTGYRRRTEYRQLPAGTYTFQVQAIDRDFNYSPLAECRLQIIPDPRIESLNVALAQSGPQGEFVGISPALVEVQTRLKQIAPVDTTVLILGETGTGKGLAARTLHGLSPRRDRPLVTFSCGGQPDSLIESELFGHEKGAFTGATARHYGKVELAKGGTLFLDEIGDLSATGQLKLLRLLEERTFERLGGSEELHADVRVVAATNRDLHRQIAAGGFREDLYFRLQGFEVHLPPLRQRQEDIPLLALYFLGRKAAHLQKPVTGLSKAAETTLLTYDWPGNVRELEHAIETAVVVCKSDTVQAEDLSLGRQALSGPLPTQRLTLEENERRYIEAVLADTDGRISGPDGAAAVLGLPESSLRYRIKKLGIKRS